MSNFEYFKYDEAGAEVPYLDAPDNLANNLQQVVSFQHVPTGHDVYFKAYITAFNESFNSDWAAESVYGRADPIYMYKNTVRKITLSFKVPAATEGESYENLGRLQKLISFLYPRYSDVQKAQTISQSPLIRLKVMNLLQQADQLSLFVGDAPDWSTTPPKKLFDSYSSSNVSWLGLLGTINNVNIDHHLGDDIGTLVPGPNVILPKLLEITVDFNAIHEHPLGWDEDDNFSAVFPYNVLTEGTVATYTSPSTTSTDSEGNSDSGTEPESSEIFPPEGQDVTSPVSGDDDTAASAEAAAAQMRLAQASGDPTVL